MPRDSLENHRQRFQDEALALISRAGKTQDVSLFLEAGQKRTPQMLTKLPLVNAIVSKNLAGSWRPRSVTTTWLVQGGSEAFPSSCLGICNDLVTSLQCTAHPNLLSDAATVAEEIRQEPLIAGIAGV